MGNINNSDNADNPNRYYAHKQEVRRQMHAKRQQLLEQERHINSQQICRHLLDICAPYAQKSARPTVFTYIPFRNEADITPLIHSLWDIGFRVAVPKTDFMSRHMEPHVISSLDQLISGTWGIPEPYSAAPIITLDTIDVMLIPALAFDLHGVRLGYGGGFYDRFLSRYDDLGMPHPLKLGVCFETQLVDKLPMEQHDLHVDRIVTEKGVYDITPLKSS